MCICSSCWDFGVLSSTQRCEDRKRGSLSEGCWNVPRLYGWEPRPRVLRGSFCCIIQFSCFSLLQSTLVTSPVVYLPSSWKALRPTVFAMLCTEHTVHKICVFLFLCTSCHCRLPNWISEALCRHWVVQSVRTTALLLRKWKTIFGSACWTRYYWCMLFSLTPLTWFSACAARTFVWWE